MSKSSAESQSRGGSVRDVRMASSNNTSPEGGSPPHQNRIRQEWVVYFYLQGWLGRHFNYMEPVVSGWKIVINIPVRNFVVGKVF
ncbi:hypothetical protein DPX16_14181 [Anabarilius grahami]|uniref:Uncharacterized protein n=1 Tax=Anabarilius grahami TaxID=495550 RepID=A0A3N0XHS4_ANAGA|nr:hypothetical protein DPX16_14181 [Anabarilius grahami]